MVGWNSHSSSRTFSVINPFSRTNFLSPDQWKARAQAIQDRLKDWSLDELLRGERLGDEPHRGLGSGHGRGYDPNQPRVAAGHPDGGQWTKVGVAYERTVDPVIAPHGHQAYFGGIGHDNAHSELVNERSFSLVNHADAGQPGQQPSVEVRRVGAASVGTNLAWRCYAELRERSTEDERAVEETTKILSSLLVSINRTAARVPGLTARLYGILVHTEFAIAVRALKLPPDLGTLEVEQSFQRSGPARYGQRGSIRTDVILRNAQGVIIAIYDVKTGDAEMRPSTEQRYREYTSVSPAVQIFILRARRGQR